jgi:type I restriction-modification system DNA methylase subunit
MSSEIATEGEIRKAMIEADLVDCMVSLPSQLFYNTQIPACLWFLARNKTETTKFRNRTNEVLFIDARELGTMISRKQKELLAMKTLPKFLTLTTNGEAKNLKQNTKTLQGSANLPIFKTCSQKQLHPDPRAVH